MTSRSRMGGKRLQTLKAQHRRVFEDSDAPQKHLFIVLLPISKLLHEILVVVCLISSCPIMSAWLANGWYCEHSGDYANKSDLKSNGRGDCSTSPDEHIEYTSSPTFECPPIAPKIDLIAVHFNIDLPPEKYLYLLSSSITAIQEPSLRRATRCPFLQFLIRMCLVHWTI